MCTLLLPNTTSQYVIITANVLHEGRAKSPAR